jgi:hypothetical protein
LPYKDFPGISSLLSGIPVPPCYALNLTICICISFNF